LLDWDPDSLAPEPGASSSGGHSWQKGAPVCAASFSVAAWDDASKDAFNLNQCTAPEGTLMIFAMNGKPQVVRRIPA
jgi:hypothetical protein